MSRLSRIHANYEARRIARQQLRVSGASGSVAGAAALHGCAFRAATVASEYPVYHAENVCSAMNYTERCADQCPPRNYCKALA